MPPLWILAQAAANGAPVTPGPAAPWYVQLIASPLSLMAVALLLMLWFSNQSKKRQEKERKQMLDSLKKNAEVQTVGGIIGKVIETRDDRVLVKVDETSNTKIWFARTAISRVTDPEKTETRA